MDLIYHLHRMSNTKPETENSVIPTKAQFCSSYNAKYGTSHSNGLGAGTNFIVTNKVSLYVITSETNPEAYWMASAYSDDASSVWNAGCDGDVNYCDYSNPKRGVRPLVRLPAGVKAEKSGNAWTFTK